MLNVLQCLPTYISTNTTTNIAAAGVNVTLHTVVIPKTTTGTVTFQDRAGSPNSYFVLPASTVAGTYTFDCVFNNGLAVVTSASDVVVVNTVQ